MEKIIIDTDPGIDDFAAILFAVDSKKFDILGITTVTGNCSLENATRNCLKALELSEENDIKVYKGASEPLSPETKGVSGTNVHGENGFSNVEYSVSRATEEKDGVDFLIETVNKYPGEITLVPIGPLTNIALAIKKDENFAKNVKRVVLMGGGENKFNITKNAEFNFYKDPLSAKIVFEAGFKEIVMIGLDVTTKVVLNSSLEKFLLDKNTELSRFWYDISRNGANFDRQNAGTDGSIINDSLTIGYLLDESLLKLKDAFVEISLEKENLGQSIVYNNYLEMNKLPNARVAYDVNSSEFLKLLFKTIFKDSKSKINQIIDKYYEEHK